MQTTNHQHPLPLRLQGHVDFKQGFLLVHQAQAKLALALSLPGGAQVDAKTLAAFGGAFVDRDLVGHALCHQLGQAQRLHLFVVFDQGVHPLAATERVDQVRAQDLGEQFGLAHQTRCQKRVLTDVVQPAGRSLGVDPSTELYLDQILGFVMGAGSEVGQGHGHGR